MRAIKKKAIVFTLLSVAITIGLAAALTTGTVFGGNGDGVDEAIAAQERHNGRLLAIDGVVGTAVGHGPEGRGAVFVFTAKPGVAGIPNEVDGVRVVPHVTGVISALYHKDGHGKGGDDPAPPPEDPVTECSTTERCPRPVPIGVSTGHPSITAGTIGARVKDAAGNVYALSNNHVYAASNTARIGDNVLQPGPFDGGINPDDAIGTLAAFVPIDFTGGDNVVDAAIALSSTANLGNATLSDGYGTPKSTTTAAAINQKVKKYGRTTGETKGQVFAINATVNVNYGSPGVARFVGQIIITPGTFSAGGDSGSLIVADPKGRNKAGAGEPVGLLFAGSSSITIANPIDAVLGAFGVTVDGE